ncbi:MAG: hypothetical protein ACRCUY_10455 [Thermoguttaceae bacterium]
MAGFHPFRTFQKNQKVWLAILGVGTMISFIILPALMQLIPGYERMAPIPELATCSRFGNVSRQHLDNLQRDREDLERLYTVLYRSLIASNAANSIDQATMTAQMESLQELEREIGILGQLSEEEVINRWLLAQYAKEKGMAIDDETVITHLARLSGGLLTDEVFNNATRSVGIPMKRLKYLVSEAILVAQMERMFQLSQSTLSPATRWDWFQRLNRQMTAEVAVIPVEEFVVQVSDPSAAQLQKLFDERKEIEKNPAQKNTGFTTPTRLAFQYVKAAPSQKILDSITDDEIKTYYEANKETHFRKQLTPPPPNQRNQALPNLPGMDTNSLFPNMTGRPGSTAFPAPPRRPAQKETAEESTKQEPEAVSVEPKTEALATEPASETPKTEAPATEPASETPKTEAPATEPASETPKTEAPATEPASETPKTEAPATEPASETPKTEAPATEPASETPKTEAPATEPASDAPKTEAPATEPASDAPKTTSMSLTRPVWIRLVSMEKEEPPKTEAPATEPASDAPKTTSASNEVVAPVASSVEIPATEVTKPTTQEKPVAENSGDKSSDAKTPVTETPVSAIKEESKEETAQSGVVDLSILYQPLSEVESQIRQSLAAEKAEQSLKVIEDKMREHFQAYNLYIDTASEMPKMPDLSQLAAENNLVLETVPLSTLFGFLKDELSRGAKERSTIGQLFFETPLLYNPMRFEGDENPYLFWVTEISKPETPKNMESVKEDVQKSLKMTEAFSVAKKRAAELVNEAKKSGKTLADTFAGQKGVTVVETEPFTWKTYGPGLNMFASIFARQGRPPMTDDVREKGVAPNSTLLDNKAIFYVGNDFMEAASVLGVGEVGMSTNEPEDAVYVIRMIGSYPSDDALWDNFQNTPLSDYILTGLFETQYKSRESWLKQIQEKTGFKWIQKPEQMRRRR